MSARVKTGRTQSEHNETASCPKAKWKRTPICVFSVSDRAAQEALGFWREQDPGHHACPASFLPGEKAI